MTSTRTAESGEASGGEAPRRRARVPERLMHAAVLLGLAAPAPPATAKPEETPRESALAPAGRAAPVGGPDEPRGWQVDHLAVAGWLARLGGLAVGAIAGALVLFLVASSISPHVGNAVANVVSIQLDVPPDAALPALGERSVVYAADGTVLATLHDEVYRELVPLDAVPPHVQDAVIAAEDRKFWEHPGYDLEGIGRALVANAQAGTIEQGGSTITQQLAKSAVGSEQTFERKINELLYAVALEEEFSKEQLLERYLNQVYFGAGAYGIAAAAEEFFGIDQGQLDVDQAALLAGLVRSPASTDPRENPELARARRDQVLAGMVAMGRLDPELLPVYQARPVDVLPNQERERRTPHFVDAVIKEFVENPVFGATQQDRFDLLYSGGLRIYTTVDPRLQEIAHRVLTAQFADPSGPTGAIAAVDPRNGRVLAVEGGVAYDLDQFNLAVQARRQPGSAFKPFIYTTALELGFPLTMTLEGSSPAYFEGVCGWARENPPGCAAEREDLGVENYGGASYGRVTMREGLVKSINTAAAQLIQIVGADRVAATAADMGIDVAAAIGQHPNPAIALGGLARGVTPLEMASAYGTFANGGTHIEPYVIDSVLNRAGEELFRNRPQGGTQAVHPAVNAAMVDLMQAVVTSGTGTRARLGGGWNAAGKTGTTQNSADAWFVGYTPVMSTAVWMGHKDELVPMRGVTGGSLPAGLWRQFMTEALQAYVDGPVPFPDVQYNEREVVEGEPVVVPDVRGLDETAALQRLADAKLIGDVGLVNSRTAAGTVLWQSPDAGQPATTGDQIRLGVSTGYVPPPPPPPRPSRPDPEPSQESSPSPDEGGAPEPDDDSGPPGNGNGRGRGNGSD